MRINAIVCFCTLLLASYSVAATEITIPQNPKILPLGNFSVMEVQGKIFLVSDDGRYVSEAQVTDNWSGKKLSTFDDVNYSLQHLPLKELGFKPDELNSFTIGTGKHQVAVFVDPLCTTCKKLVADAKKYSDTYTFKFMVVPALGDQSHKLSRQYFCRETGDQSIEDLFLNGGLSSLPQKSNCDTTLYDKTLITAQLFKVDAVPFAIDQNGETRRGYDPNFWHWLKR